MLTIPARAASPPDSNLSALPQLALSQFAAIGKAMGIEPADLQNPHVVNYGTFVVAANAKWFYRADVSDNQAFGPTAYSPLLLSLVEQPNDTPFVADDSEKELKTVTRSIGEKLGFERQQAFVPAIARKECLLFERCGEKLQSSDGRYLIRYNNPNQARTSDRYQLMFDARKHPLRLDATLTTEATERIKNCLYEGLRDGVQARVASDEKDNLTFGTFFAETEARFEADARSFEGEALPSPAVLQNPFDGATDSTNWWKFNWWDIYGRVNSVRGNWDEAEQKWQKPTQVLHHSLQGYSLRASTGQELSPNAATAVDLRIGDNFYKDLEQCDIAAFFTHGGPINNKFQLKAAGDHWFVPANAQSKFGSGHLRHLFSKSCGALGYVHEPWGTLATEWLPAININGLRTVCGVDGKALGWSAVVGGSLVTTIKTIRSVSPIFKQI